MRTMTGGSPIGATWYSDTSVAATQRPRLTSELNADVCVVGGGLAGLTVAREVARRGRSVVVLEARRIAWNASGRNGGVVRPGFAEPLDNIIDRVGLARARELWTLSVRGVDYVRDAARETGMAGVHPVEGFLNVSNIDRDARCARSAVLLRDLFGAEVALWPTDRVRELLRSERYFEALHWPRAFHIHPLNYALGLAAAAERSGARIFEETPAVAVDVAGDRKQIDAGEGRVRAQHVVLAGGALLGPVVPVISGTMVPITLHMAVTAPLGERLGEAIRFAGAVAESRLGSDQYRVVEGNRLLWGAGASIRRLEPSRVAQRITGRILRVFPQLGLVDVAQAWSGVVGYAVHRMPQLGEIMPGVWQINAFGNLGLNNTAMAGELIASAVAEGDDRWRLFSRYELVWAGGAAGAALTGLLLRGANVRERLDPVISPLTRIARRAGQRGTRGASKAAHAVIDVASALGSMVELRRKAPRPSTAHRAATKVDRPVPEAGQRMSAVAIAQNAEMLHRDSAPRPVQSAPPGADDAERNVVAGVALKANARFRRSSLPE
jgi:glycine/D-amino acid oxidase-like deaminating enzyme